MYWEAGAWEDQWQLGEAEVREVYPFSRATVIKYHKLGTIDMYSLTVLEAGHPKWRAWQGVLSLKAVGEDPSSPSVVASIPWLADMSHQYLPPSSHAVECLCSIFPLFIRTPVIRLEITLIPWFPMILTWLYLQRFYFQIMSHSQVARDRIETYLGEGDTIQSTFT